MCDYYVELLCAVSFGLGWAHDAFNVAYHMLMHFHAYVPSFLYILILNCLVLFCLSPSLSLFLSLVALWHLNENLLCPGTLFIPRHFLFLPPLILLHLMSNSVMIKPVRTFWRTSHDEAFIWNTKSFYHTFPILTFPLSSTVGVRSQCMASRSLVPPWSYRSFTPICTNWIIQYLILSLTFKVCVS